MRKGLLEYQIPKINMMQGHQHTRASGSRPGFPNLGSAGPWGSANELDGVCKNIINIKKTYESINNCYNEANLNFNFSFSQ